MLEQSDKEATKPAMLVIHKMLKCWPDEKATVAIE